LVLILILISLRDVRYHFDGPTDFEHLIKPGLLSDGLRKALGLSASDIPLYIYRMRVLGYPPGWLEDIKSSNLHFIGDLDPFSSSEEDSVSFDVERIISFPGFNVQLEPGYFDVIKLEFKKKRVLNLNFFKFYFRIGITWAIHPCKIINPKQK